MTDRPDGQTIVATDTASGEIVYQLDQSWDEETWEEVWEWDEESGVGAMVLRNADGVEIVRLPMEAIEAAYEAQMPQPVDERAEEWSPDLWLAATTNGFDWLVVDLDDPDPRSSEYWPASAAINGDRVLYRTVDGWQTATVGS